jgi:formate hydrogenlyase subunit 3/multisubunit Na+/H+ antiporter MnhD subunit
MPLATPLLPITILLLGAGLLPLTKRVARGHVRYGLTLLVAGSFLAVTLSLYWSRSNYIILPLWRPASLFGTELGYQADSLSLLFAALIGFITLVVIIAQGALLTSGERDHHPYGAIFLIAAGAVSLIFAADLVTLCLSWSFLDLGLLFLIAFVHRGKASSRTGLRLLAINYLAGLALLASLLILQGLGETATLQTTLLPSRVISLVLLATLMRLGLYPALVALPADVEMSLPTVISWYIIPFSAGAYLLARITTLAPVAPVPGREIALFLGSLALVLSPFPLWFETSLKRAASFLVLNQVGYLALASTIASPYAAAIVSSQAISLTLALSLLFLGQLSSREPVRHPYHIWTRGCTFVAVASLVGTPLTLGFVGRWLLFRSLIEAALGPLILLSLVGNSFLLSPLLKMFLEPVRQGSNQGPVRPLLLAVMTALAVPLVILGLHPPFVEVLVGQQSALSTIPPLQVLVSSVEPPLSLALIGGILLSLTLGYLMYHKGEIIVARAGISLETLTKVAKMEWLNSAVGWAVRWTTSILEQLGSLFEERRAVGWILLFATLVALLVLSS